MTAPPKDGPRGSIDAQNPWPGLQSFDEPAEHFFNGRGEESLELRRLVPQATLTTLFGASGLGKTSLLKAGLFPLLRRANFLPIYIRLDVTDRKAPLLEQAKATLEEQIEALGVDAPAFKAEESLWEYLHREQLELWSPQNQLLTPVFVFDQFEEVFTLGADNAAAIARLRIDLADLIENRIPATLVDRVQKNEAAGVGLSLNSHGYKVLLSFREDFLPAVEGEPRHREGWKRELPSILRNRLRLLPMSGDRAFEAVHTTAPHLVDEPLARKIVCFVAASEEPLQGRDTREDLSELVVEPALLSVVCRGLNEKRKALGKATFDETLLSTSGRAIISDFYHSAVSELPEQVRRLIEDDLITEHGFRKPCDLDDALSVHGVTEVQLRALVDKRLLRIEPYHGTNRVELTHDLLTPIVREQRDLRRARVRREKERLERLRRWKRALALLAIMGLLVVSAAVLATNARSAQLKKADGERMKAHTLLRAQQYDAALASFMSALGVYEKRAVSKDQISTLLDIGDLYAVQRRFKDADTNYQKALDVNREVKDRSLEGEALESLASIKEQEQDLPSALEYYEQALQAYLEDPPDYRGSGRILERLGQEAEQSMALQRAVEYFDRALKSYTIVGDQLGKIRVERARQRLLGRWGFLVDLHTAQIHELKSAAVNIGRDVPGIQNEISFSNQAISRRHLVINQEGHLDDLRSANGTSVNARILPYGIAGRFTDRDIIVLANVQALQFRKEQPTDLVRPPSGTWAIFINGTSRSYSYLTAPEYSLEMRGWELVLLPGATEKAVMRLRLLLGKAEMLPMRNGWHFRTTLKHSDYEYGDYVLNTGRWIELIDVPLECFSPELESAEPPAFQIVRF